MTFFLPLWLMWTLGICGSLVYLSIGYVHFALNRGTSYSHNLGKDILHLFFWPFIWIPGVWGILKIFLPGFRRR